MSSSAPGGGRAAAVERMADSLSVTFALANGRVLQRALFSARRWLPPAAFSGEILVLTAGEGGRQGSRPVCDMRLRVVWPRAPAARRLPHRGGGRGHGKAGRVPPRAPPTLGSSRSPGRGAGGSCSGADSKEAGGAGLRAHLTSSQGWRRRQSGPERHPQERVPGARGTVRLAQEIEEDRP